jgi:hypothetical protein
MFPVKYTGCKINLLNLTRIDFKAIYNTHAILLKIKRNIPFFCFIHDVLCIPSPLESNNQQRYHPISVLVHIHDLYCSNEASCLDKILHTFPQNLAMNDK